MSEFQCIRNVIGLIGGIFLAALLIGLGADAEWSKHPVAVLFGGAVLSGFLLPSLARAWQNHQKELEVKVNLLSEISHSITGILMALQTSRDEADPADQTRREASLQKLQEASHEWEVKGAVIRTKLRAYYSVFQEEETQQDNQSIPETKDDELTSGPSGFINGLWGLIQENAKTWYAHERFKYDEKQSRKISRVRSGERKLPADAEIGSQEYIERIRSRTDLMIHLILNTPITAFSAPFPLGIDRVLLHLHGRQQSGKPR